MAGIVFFFEKNDVDVFSGRQIDLSAWNYAIKAAGDISKVIVVNKTSVDISNFNSDLEYFSVVSDLPDLSGRLTHIVCPWDIVDSIESLWDFNHNTDWYLFGPAEGWRRYGRLGHGVTVPMAGHGSLHALHIASVVMLHRYGVRSWQLQQ
jgi:hypothetical protein